MWFRGKALSSGERVQYGSNLSDITHKNFSILSKIAMKPNTATNMCIVDGFLTL